MTADQMNTDAGMLLHHAYLWRVTRPEDATREACRFAALMWARRIITAATQP